MSKEDALQQLPKIFGDYTRGTVTEVESDQPPGRVIEQSPQAGTMVRPGTSVNLVVSKSPPIPDQPKYIPVPKVIDMSYAKARSELEARGLVIEVVEGDSRPPYTVSQQDPAPGTQVPPGKHVKLWFPIP